MKLKLKKKNIEKVRQELAMKVYSKAAEANDKPLKRRSSQASSDHDISSRR